MCKCCLLRANLTRQAPIILALAVTSFFLLEILIASAILEDG
jgi:hypothetical protein